MKGSTGIHVGATKETVDSLRVAIMAVITSNAAYRRLQVTRQKDYDLPGNADPDPADRKAAGTYEDWKHGIDQRRDRKQMAAEDVAKARDLIHAYGDARVRANATPYSDQENYKRHGAEAADAFAKLIILVAELAKGAYE